MFNESPNNIGIYSCSFDILYFDDKYKSQIIGNKNIPGNLKKKIKHKNISIGLLLLFNDTKEIISDEEAQHTIKTTLHKEKIKTDNIYSYIENIKIINYHGNINYKLKTK